MSLEALTNRVGTARHRAIPPSELDVRVSPQSVPPAGTAADDVRARGWQLAHWLVTRGEAYKLDTVDYDGRTWSAASAAGWQPIATGAVAPNLDLVHIVVARGG